MRVKVEETETGQYDNKSMIDNSLDKITTRYNRSIVIFGQRSKNGSNVGNKKNQITQLSLTAALRI